MRNALIVGLAVICAAIILSTGGLDAQSENAATPSLNLTGTLALLDPPQRHVVGITTTTFPAFDLSSQPGNLAVKRVCFAEFSETTVCSMEEVLNTLPPPSPWPDFVMVLDANFGNIFFCIDGNGGTDSGGGFAGCSIESPVMCCGF